MKNALEVRGLSVYYGTFQALKSITLDIPERMITALIGPSGCGKSTFLRSLNRMNDLVEGSRIEGSVYIDGRDIYGPGTDLLDLRKRVGMVFQRPNPFPLSVYDNVVYGLRVHGMSDRGQLDERLVRSLESVHLWEELKDRLNMNALELSGEQQQRLCVARMVAVEPEIILMDEPCSALDAEGTEAVEQLLLSLRDRYTVLIVTHNMGQASRISDECLFMLSGVLVEQGPTRQIFMKPRDKRTEEYVEGRYG